MGAEFSSARQKTKFRKLGKEEIKTLRYSFYTTVVRYCRSTIMTLKDFIQRGEESCFPVNVPFETRSVMSSRVFITFGGWDFNKSVVSCYPCIPLSVPIGALVSVFAEDEELLRHQPGSFSHCQFPLTPKSVVEKYFVCFYSDEMAQCGRESSRFASGTALLSSV